MNAPIRSEPMNQLVDATQHYLKVINDIQDEHGHVWVRFAYDAGQAIREPTPWFARVHFQLHGHRVEEQAIIVERGNR